MAKWKMANGKMKKYKLAKLPNCQMAKWGQIGPNGKMEKRKKWQSGKIEK